MALSALSAVKKYLREDGGLFKSGIIFLLGSLLAAGLNYMYHLSMGRMLGPKEYGILGSLFAIIYIALFSSMTFSRVVSKHAAEFHSRKQMPYLKRLVQRSFFKTVSVGAVFLALYLLSSPFIAQFMKIDDIASIALVGIIAYFSVASEILTGALNGLQKFVWQNASGFVSVLLKFSLAVLLVYLGFGVKGALIAIIVGLFASIFISTYPLRESLKNIKSEKFDSRKVYAYAVPVFFASLLPILLITFDQVLVKHFFSSAEAGYYAAAGMIAKIIWFGSGFLVLALFPKIASLSAQGKDTSRLLMKCIAYNSLLVVLGGSLYFAFPNLIVSLLYGAKYLVIAPFIGILGLSMGFFSITQTLITYNLAVERYSFIWIILLGFIIEIAGIALFHSTITEIINILFGVNIFILSGMVIYNRNELGAHLAW